MKKLSVLMASLMCLTVGGVYAAWTYAETNVGTYHADPQNVILAGVNTENNLSYGTYSVQFKDFSITIDSAQGANLMGEGSSYHQHEAVLVVKGTVTVNFKPNDLASDDIKNYGLLTETYFSFGRDQSAMQWEGNNIFTAMNEHRCRFGYGDDNTESGQAIKWEKQADGSFSYTYDTTELQDLLVLRQDIVLDSSEKHDQFLNALGTLGITVHMHQVTTA